MKSTKSLSEPQAVNNFCSRPWSELHIEEDGQVTPCCVMPSNRFPMGNSVKEYLQGEPLKELQQSFLENKKHPSCEYCWEAERNNLHTHRVRNTPSSEKTIEKVHIRLNNVCNFKCRMCNPNFSTTWAIENKKHKYFTFEDTDTETNAFKKDPTLLPLLKHLISSGHLECINVSGGEPLITDANYDMLTYLIENKCTDVQIIYSTNLSMLQYKKHDLKDLWAKFKKVELLVSCDGWGPSVEYSRTGFSTKTFVKNIQEVFDYVSAVVCVVNNYSVWSIPKQLSIFDKLGKSVTLSPCFLPSFLSPQILPRELKQEIKKMYSHDPRLAELYNNYIDKDVNLSLEYHSDANEPDTDVDELKYFIDYSMMLDKFRDTDFFETFPEYEPYRKLTNTPPKFHDNVMQSLKELNL